jgi:cell division protein FtsI/penicillin-binding protein 2
METKTGKVRAIANLGRANDGTYETTNYAVAESHEPGSTFKLVDLMAILEDKLYYSTVYDTYGGEIRYSGRQYGILIREDMEKYLWLEDSSYPQIPLWFRRFTKITKITLQNLSTM